MRKPFIINYEIKTASDMFLIYKYIFDTQIHDIASGLRFLSFFFALGNMSQIK